MRFPTCHPAFQKTLMDWVTEPRGELGHKRGHRQDSAESPLHPTENQKDIPFNFKHRTIKLTNNMLKYFPVCLYTCTNKRWIVATHRGAVCVGQRECYMLWRVDQWGPCQMCCYFSLDVFLKVCVDFKNCFNPLVRKEDIMSYSVRRFITVEKII